MLSLPNSSHNDKDFAGSSLTATGFNKHFASKRQNLQNRDSLTKLCTTREDTEDFMGGTVEMGGAVHRVAPLWDNHGNSFQMVFDGRS